MICCSNNPMAPRKLSAWTHKTLVPQALIRPLKGLNDRLRNPVAVKQQ